MNNKKYLKNPMYWFGILIGSLTGTLIAWVILYIIFSIK